MMPRDTNAHGTIFGGVILSYIDQAGAIEARRQGSRLMLTVSMDKIVFHEPVFVGDLVSFWTETLRIGTTSITVKVRCEAIRRCCAQVVYVPTRTDAAHAERERTDPIMEFPGTPDDARWIAPRTTGARDINLTLRNGSRGTSADRSRLI
jgi:acyl-CoA thioesterase YciA